MHVWDSRKRKPYCTDLPKPFRNAMRTIPAGLMKISSAPLRYALSQLGQ
jgi:hypothetical protein